jgi:hypothetical protein
MHLRHVASVGARLRFLWGELSPQTPLAHHNEYHCRYEKVLFMSRVNDIGGQAGFGPVPVRDNGDPPFHADWEARVYALVKVLQRRGLFNDDALRDAIERLPPGEYLAASYYERWLAAVEVLMAEKGLLT